MWWCFDESTVSFNQAHCPPKQHEYVITIQTYLRIIFPSAVYPACVHLHVSKIMTEVSNWRRHHENVEDTKALFASY